jgi:hypothetical protein
MPRFLLPTGSRQHFWRNDGSGFYINQCGCNLQLSILERLRVATFKRLLFSAFIHIPRFYGIFTNGTFVAKMIWQV